MARIVGFVPLARAQSSGAPRDVCGYRVFGLAWISPDEMLVPFVLHVAGVVVPENLRGPEETPLVLRFVLLDHPGVRLRVSVVADSGELPGNLHARGSSGYRKRVIANLLRHIDRRCLANACQLVSEVFVERGYPLGQGHPGFTVFVEFGIA